MAGWKGLIVGIDPSLIDFSEKACRGHRTLVFRAADTQPQIGLDAQRHARPVPLRNWIITMNQSAILWPMIGHTMLVFALYALIGLRRKAAVKSGSAVAEQFRANINEPPESLYVRNSIANQFELPVLFHAVCLALFVTAGAGWIAAALAWIFVATRYLHAIVHVTSNDLSLRSPAFAAGAATLFLLWLWFALHLMQAV